MVATTPITVRPDSPKSDLASFLDPGRKESGLMPVGIDTTWSAGIPIFKIWARIASPVVTTFWAAL
jgi:hypothetical protein